jgi:hypothetical protein
MLMRGIPVALACSSYACALRGFRKIPAGTDDGRAGMSMVGFPRLAIGLVRAARCGARPVGRETAIITGSSVGKFDRSSGTTR